MLRNREEVIEELKKRPHGGKISPRIDESRDITGYPKKSVVPGGMVEEEK